MHTKVRTVKVSEVTAEANPYVLIIQAIVCRAVADALGATSPSRHLNPEEIRQEAVAWLEEAHGLTELLELAGFDAEPVVRAIQQCLAAEVAYAG